MDKKPILFNFGGVMLTVSLFTVLPFIVCLMWTVIISLDNAGGWKKYDRAYLAAFMLACSLLYLGHAVHFNSAQGSMSFVDCIYAGTNLWVYPLFYLYLRQLTTPVKLRWNAALAILPGLLVFLFSVYELYVLGRLDITHKLNRFLFPVTVVLSSTGGFLRIEKHNRLVRELYSNTEKKTYGQLLWLMVLMLIASVVSIGLNHVGRDYFGRDILLAVPSSFFSAVLFAIAYVGSRIEFAAQDAAVDFPEPPEAEPDDGIDSLVGLASRLDAIMTEGALYQQPNLKITDLAEAVASNRTYVSKALNGIKGMSFSDYVNGYRIAKAKELLLSEDSYTMSVVAEKSGFLSDTTFYRQFKALTGLTPSQWLKTVKG